MEKFIVKNICSVLLLAVMLVTLASPFAVSAEGEGFKVIFDANGGVCETESLKTDEDGTLETLPAATRPGYIFGGWYTDPDAGEYIFPSTAVFDIDTTLFAHWTKMETPVVTNPKENRTIVAKAGDDVEFGIDVEYAEEIKWFVNKNDGSDILPLEEDFFTTVTIENIEESYEGYVFFCEIRNSAMSDDEMPVMSPSFMIDIEGVEKDYDLLEPEIQKDGLSDVAAIIIVLAGVVAVSVIAAVIVSKKK